MLNEQCAERLVEFFDEYAEALALMETDEKEKLTALISNSLPRIERAINMGQANTKQIENYERKRIALQSSMECEGKTLNELISLVPVKNRAQLSALFDKIKLSVREINYLNQKSMIVARSNIIQVNPEVLASIEPREHESAVNRPYEDTVRTARSEAMPLFKAKA